MLFSISLFKIRNVLIVSSDHLNVETFWTYQWRSRQLRIKIFRHIYIAYKKMATWDPEDIDLTDRDGLGEEDDNWDEYAMNDLQNRYEELRQFNIKYNKSRDEAAREEVLNLAEVTRHDIE